MSNSPISPKRRRRAIAASSLVGLAIGAGVLGPGALASAKVGAPTAGKSAASPTVKQASNSPADTARVATRHDGKHPGQAAAAAVAAVQQLVQSGTITQGQANAVNAQIEAGSVDPGQLVSCGVLTATQMHAIGDQIAGAKRIFGT
jgi:hypothetical protein